jgi:hypothetical protein
MTANASVGNVYVFNGTPNTVTLILNGQPISGSLTGIAQGSGYAANSTTVGRSPSPGNPGNNTFGGQNSLIVSFSGGGAQTYPVNIPLGEAQISSDLQLYVFYNEVILVLPGGTAGPGGGSSQVIVGAAVPEEELAQYS